MIQFQWRNNTISISKNVYQRLKELSASFRIKKKSDGTSSSVVITGSELQSFSIPVPLVGVDALDVYETWRSQLGQIGPMLVGGTLFGPNNVMLQKVSLSSNSVSNRGELVNSTMTLTFGEWEAQGKDFKSNAMPYISPIKRDCYKDTPEAVEDLVLKVFYGDTDITDAIDINSCIHDMFADSCSDTLEIVFNDVNKVWDGWSAEKGNIISVTCGIAKSGQMFINSVDPENGLMTLKASSIPPSAKDKHSKSWEDVKTSQLAQEIAERHGLGFESYGVDDQLYSYVRQENESDFDFLQRRCDLESLAFVVYDKKLVLYSEEYLENQEPAEDIELGPEADFNFKDDALKGYGSIVIKNGSYTGEYTSSNGLDKTVTQVIQTYISSQAEANRFAKGILRQMNKKLSAGHWKDTIRRELSAGSVLNLKTTGAKSWDGKVLISHIRQDYVNSKSKVFFRKAEVL